MAVYSVEGKLGTGKTKFAVWMAQQALREGRRVAGNVDLYAHKLTPERRSIVTRIPDRPSPDDLHALGHGNPGSYDEAKNGVLLLDELGTWLNSRGFQDKNRQGVLDWLIHARKLGWDVFLIVQSAQMIDKQVRESLIEYECRCIRLDRMRIPLVGKLLGSIGEAVAHLTRWEAFKRLGYLPRMHTVTARVGYGQGAMVAERWVYRGDDLHAAYDTRQVFRSDYPHGVHSVLPPWDWSPPLSRAQRRAAATAAAELARRAALKPKRPEVEAVMRLPPGERIRALCAPPAASHAAS